MAYATIADIRKDFDSKGLIGKHLSEVLLTHSYLYHRVYAFAKREGKNLQKVWEEIGLLKSYSPTQTYDELVAWAAKNKIIGKKLCDINDKHIAKLSRYAKDSGTTLEKVYKTLGIDNEYYIVYKTIAEVRKDLADKGLVGKTPQELIDYDGFKTRANIDRFAKRQGIDLVTFYGLIGIRYSKRTEIVDGVAKVARAYKTIDDVKRDLEAKGLVGKSIREVNQYDCSKTYMLVRKFASRNDIDISGFWKELGVINSERQTYQEVPTFSSVSDIKLWLKRESISLDLRELRVQHKALYHKILEFAVKEGMERGVIWKELGIKNRVEIIHSLEDVIALLSKHGLRKATIKAIRTHGKGEVYQAITTYTAREKIKTAMVWKLLGIKAEYSTARRRLDG